MLKFQQNEQTSGIGHVYVVAFMPAPQFFPVAAWLATDPLYILYISSITFLHWQPVAIVTARAVLASANPQL